MVFFFFQAEDGIRDYKVTGVQTCALPISTAAQVRATSANFTESQKISGLVDAMVAIDETFDRIKSLRSAPASPVPDNHLSNEATLLREHFREAQRLPKAQDRGEKFLKNLAAAENHAAAFEQSLASSTDRIAIDRAFNKLADSCASCHREYRDPPLSTAKITSPLPR